MAPQHGRGGERQQHRVARIEGEGRDQQGDEDDAEAGDADPAMSDLRDQQWPDPARDRGDHVERHGHEIGAENRRDPDHHEQHRQIEGESREFGALARSRRSSRTAWRASGLGPAGRRRGRRPGEASAPRRPRRAACRAGRRTSPGDLLGLAEAALADEPHGGLRQVVTHDEDHQRRHGAESERHAPHQFVVHVENEEHGDDRQRQNLADGEHELPAVAHHLAFALGHRFHDVGVAGRDVAAERNAEEEADDGEHCDARDERLAQRQHDEQIMVARNMKRRPILSVSQPPMRAPTTAPPWVPAAARPSSSGSG